MAFYSVRIDENGREIDTPRTPNFQKSTFRCESPENHETLKETNSKISNASADYKTVTYINSATFIEKPKRKLAGDNDEKNEEASGNECNQNDSAPNSSNLSSDDRNNPQYQSHIESDFSIPLLELKSNESFPSSDSMDYSYNKVCEVTKMIQKPDAYKEWLEAKRWSKIYDQQKQKKLSDKKKEEKEERKRIADQKFNEWLLKKSQTKQPVPNIEPKEENHDVKVSSDEDKINQEKNFKAWLKKKLVVEKALKERSDENIRLDEDLAAKRKEEAERLYQEWLKTAPLKPKPVPLNRGMLTFKGSMSSIYENPIPWQFDEQYLEMSSNSL